MVPTLPAHLLEAFRALARTHHAGRAADRLGITRTSLDRRIQKLEARVQQPLFAHDASGLRLAPAGHRLLRYCDENERVARRWLADLVGDAGATGGYLSVAGFSSVVRSVAIPSLGALVREAPGLVYEISTGAAHELPRLLETGQAHFVLTHEPVTRDGVDSVFLAHETSLLVRPARDGARADLLVDHRADDHFTEDFFARVGCAMPAGQRAFAGDVYAVLDAVAAGLGRAVVPLHLAARAPGIAVDASVPALRLPVHLSWFADGSWRPLYRDVVQAFRDNAARLLEDPTVSCGAPGARRDTPAARQVATAS